MESTTKEEQEKGKKRILKLEQFDLVLTRVSFNYRTTTANLDIKGDFLFLDLVTYIPFLITFKPTLKHFS